MAAGAPGIVNGVMKERTNNTTATTRNMPIGRRVNRTSRARKTAATIAGMMEERTMGSKVIGAPQKPPHHPAWSPPPQPTDTPPH